LSIVDPCVENDFWALAVVGVVSAFGLIALFGLLLLGVCSLLSTLALFFLFLHVCHVRCLLSRRSGMLLWFPDTIDLVMKVDLGSKKLP